MAQTYWSCHECLPWASNPIGMKEGGLQILESVRKFNASVFAPLASFSLQRGRRCWCWWYSCNCCCCWRYIHRYHRCRNCCEGILDESNEQVCGQPVWEVSENATSRSSHFQTVCFLCQVSMGNISVCHLESRHCSWDRSSFTPDPICPVQTWPGEPLAIACASAGVFSGNVWTQRQTKALDSGGALAAWGEILWAKIDCRPELSSLKVSVPLMQRLSWGRPGHSGCCGRRPAVAPGLSFDTMVIWVTENWWGMYSGNPSSWWVNTCFYSMSRLL